MDPKPPSHRRRAGPNLWGLLAVSGALLVQACSSANDERSSISRHEISGGTADSAHQNVFLLGWRVADAGGLCTATLIAPNLLLTARHCVSARTGDDHVLCGDAALGEPHPADAFFTTNDPHPRDGSPFFEATEVRVPAGGIDTCGYDIALVILKQNVPAGISTPAVPRIDREVLPGERYTAVGYGQNGDGNASGKRMQLAGLRIACEPGTCGEGVESTEFRGETGICSGDSGGPALDTDGKVVGVVSRGGPDCSTPVYGTVTAWHDFIIETARRAAALGGYPAPFWVATGSSDRPATTPEPGVTSDGGASGGGAGSTDGKSAGTGCQASGECANGLVCVAPPTGGPGQCTATCGATADCEDGLACQAQGEISVCTAPIGNADEGAGCSTARALTPRSAAEALLVLLGVGFAAARRASARTERNPDRHRRT